MDTTKELIKEIWELWESMAECGELHIGPQFSANYKRLKAQVEQKLNLPGIGSKRPSDQEILQVLDLAQCELREMLKRNKYAGSTALFAVDNLYEVLKAACAPAKGAD